jgi:GGDEF domain-containing protein
MPTEHHDSRTSERIEAFLEGPAGPARKRSRSGARRPHRPIDLVSEPEWRDALLREDVRVRRYGRPATVMVVDVIAHRGPGVETAAPTIEELIVPVLDAIRNEARETDHVAQTSATRFHLLLPETGEADAGHIADRLRRASGDRLNGHAGALRLRVESTTPGHGRSLRDALADTERRLAD